MRHESESQILEIQSDTASEMFRALAVESRVEILRLLSAGDRNINELGAELGLSQSTVTRHVQQLEQSGLILSEYVPGAQGMQKRCRLGFSRLIVNLAPPVEVDEKVEEVSMPIGLYTLVSPGAPCGLANRTKFIGFLDKTQSFYDPERATAEILWMANGFVEYTFPNDLPTTMDVERLEFSMEVCSEAPDHNPDWPSDLTLWVNGVEVGTWTCPGDFGGKRAHLNPSWWVDHMTQHGLLKVWSIDRRGAYVDGTKISDIDVSRLMLLSQQSISVRFGVKPDAEHQGGFNLFGRGFGNYSQDLVLRLHYDRRRESPSGKDSIPSISSEKL
ncbi:MAG: ArsR family transcriptional regulator [Verrucomicrobiaceae bacterium]|nr:MAG: ArsR family transcriptional regulator [Verrucomicrobiaceae bacterium]